GRWRGPLGGPPMALTQRSGRARGAPRRPHRWGYTPGETEPPARSRPSVSTASWSSPRSSVAPLALTSAPALARCRGERSVPQYPSPGRPSRYRRRQPRSGIMVPRNRSGDDSDERTCRRAARARPGGQAVTSATPRSQEAPGAERTLKIGIAGLGVGSAMVIPTVERLPIAELAAAADTRPEALEQFGQRYGGRTYE